MIGQVFGGKCGESSASYDPKSSSWKTCQISLISELNTYSDHWPKSGMMRNGTLYPRKTSVRPISANGSGLWPTPCARDWKDTPGMSLTGINPDGSIRDRTAQLAGRVYESDKSGHLNPQWVEWLMAYPSGWTDLEDSETPSCPKSLNGSLDE